MGRRPRHEVLYDGCYAHVFSRSFNHHWIFKETDHFETFRTLLQMVKRLFGFSIHHYCLMSTHFHLVSSIPSVKKFSEGLRHLKSEYTRYFNQKLNRTGPLWRERFKSLLIEDERYLSSCGLYVEANPLAAGMVAKPEDWPYSSARHYLVGITQGLRILTFFREMR